MPNAIESVNQKESVDAIYASLEADGKKETKATIDRVLDKSRDLAINVLVKGQDIKIRGLGTLKVVQHQERAYTLPNGITGTAPAGVHVLFVESDALLTAMNTTTV